MILASSLRNQKKKTPKKAAEEKIIKIRAEINEVETRKNRENQLTQMLVL